MKMFGLAAMARQIEVWKTFAPSPGKKGIGWAGWQW